MSKALAIGEAILLVVIGIYYTYSTLCYHPKKLLTITTVVEESTAHNRCCEILKKVNIWKGGDIIKRKAEIESLLGH